MSEAAPASYAPVTLRRARPADAETCGHICFEAFRAIAERHNFPPDIPTPEEAIHMLSFMFSTPGFFCVVAQQGERLVGSNCMFEADPIASIGPITVALYAQDSGAGRQLMQAVLDRAAELSKPGVRLVQSAYHARSLTLYAKLGFIVREPLAVCAGAPPSFDLSGARVRHAVAADHDLCNQLCHRVHGHDRARELAGALQQGSAMIVERDRRITAYTTGIGFLGHAVAETDDDLKLLIASATHFGGPGFLVPMRNAELFSWCLEQGLRVKYVMTLMSLGLYNQPQGAWLPSVAY